MSENCSHYYSKFLTSLKNPSFQLFFISFEERWMFCFPENLRKVTYRSLNKYGSLYYWVGSKTLYTFSCINLNVRRVPQRCKHGAEKQWPKNPYGYISLSLKNSTDAGIPYSECYWLYFYLFMRIFCSPNYSLKSGNEKHLSLLWPS